MIAIFDTEVIDKYTQDKINMKLNVLSEISGKNKIECLVQAIDLLIEIKRKKNEIDNDNNPRKRDLLLQLRADKS